MGWRGGRFLKAFYFISMVGEGMSVRDANIQTMAMNKAELAEHADAALMCANNLYGGNLNRVIQTAKIIGFAG